MLEGISHGHLFTLAIHANRQNVISQLLHGRIGALQFCLQQGNQLRMPHFLQGSQGIEIQPGVFALGKFVENVGPGRPRILSQHGDDGPLGSWGLGLQKFEQRLIRSRKAGCGQAGHGDRRQYGHVLPDVVGQLVDRGLFAKVTQPNQRGILNRGVTVVCVLQNQG